MDSEGVISGPGAFAEPADRRRRHGRHAGTPGPGDGEALADRSDEIADLTASELEDTLQLEVLPRALLGSYLIG